MFSLYPRFEKVGVYWFTSVRPAFRPSLPSFRPSPFWWKFFVKDFSTNMQARMLIFGVQVDEDLLYRGIDNQPSPAYLSLYLSKFLSFHTLMKFFLKDFSITMQSRMLIFGCRLMMTCCIVGLRTSFLLLICPCICPIFFPSNTLKNDFFRQRFLNNHAR